MNVRFRSIADMSTAIQCRPMSTQDSLTIGDRLQLGGGYEPNSAWLSGRASVLGTVTQFIPGQNGSRAVVVQLDEPISGESLSGSTVVLQLRYADAKWEPTETVHVELCDFTPEPKVWKDRRQGEWIESHATYRLVSD